ncbi:tyrosine phosphatase [Bifidobacterium goeldii]|uniref:Tyrosine phosphatase n=1 Tax=Bifidobacterium goeldii TaxID=2306975 RepID=A0A430FL00_9BIFI|nr:zinc ribbon domain-containing protein [Bifidobacterium goeldii]RSX53585.1 tyrosine phosphatase [Bifidobacterium goeldii]
MSARFCTSCGSPLSENARFCTTCGQAVSTANAPAAPSEPNAPVTPDSLPETSPVPPAAPQPQQPEQQPTAQQPEQQPEQSESSPSQPKQHRRTIIIIAAVCAVVLVIAAVAGGLWWSHHNQETQLAACQSMLSRIKSGEGAASKKIERAQELSHVTADQVDDQSTVEALAKAQKELGSAVSASDYQCPTDARAAELKTTTEHMDKAWSAQNKHLKALVKAADAVETSRASKSFTADKADLQSKLSDAQSLLTSSQGRVFDDTARNQLQTEIAKVNDTLSSITSKDADKLSEASKELQTAVDAVNKAVSDYTADHSRCQSFAGGFGAFQAGGSLILSADCSYKLTGPMDVVYETHSYASQSFTKNNDGSYSWRNEAGDTISYLPPGVHSPQMDEYYAASNMTTPDEMVQRAKIVGPGLYVKGASGVTSSLSN